MQKNQEQDEKLEYFSGTNEVRGCVFGATRRRAEAVEDHGHTESCLEKVGNKTSKCVPSKAYFSIEPGTGPEIQGLLPYYCFQKGPGRP